MQQILNTLAYARSAARTARSLVAAGIMVWAIAPSPCIAQPTAPPDFGLDWVTVGDPGNGPVPDELFRVSPPFPIPLGKVDYEFRMTRTEITVGQWFEFVRAYEPFFTGSPNDPAFTGFGISFIFGQYVIDNLNEVDFPTTMSWEFAARYANWLHNGKAITQDAFENGAYDTSTFTTNEDGTLNHQIGHHPGARYWIPTFDEWTKAAHYDPNRFGPGQGGYWYNLGSQDETLISGPPGVGQTNAGPNGVLTDVGSYPGVQSPWGLLDTSGGVPEWTELFTNLSFRRALTRGSSAGETTYDRRDPIEFWSAFDPETVFFGTRLASAIPSPTSGALLVVSGALFSLRYRRRVSCVH